MGLRHIFGHAFDRKLITREDDRPLKLPTQNPRIYLFTSHPSRTQGSAGTSAIQTITAWEEKTDPPFARIYRFSEIEDPNPTSDTGYQEYWEAINFVTEASGQEQQIIRLFRVERVESSDSTHGTTRETLKEIYPKIVSYISDDDDLDDAIVTAETELETYFASRDMKWSRVYGAYKLKLAVAYKAIEVFCRGEFKEENDRHHLRMKMYEKLCSDQLGLVAIDYRKDGSASVEVVTKPTSGSWDISR